MTYVAGDMRSYGYDKVGASGGVITYSAVADNGATASLSYDGTTFTQFDNYLLILPKALEESCE